MNSCVNDKYVHADDGSSYLQDEYLGMLSKMPKSSCLKHVRLHIFGVRFITHNFIPIHSLI